MTKLVAVVGVLTLAACGGASPRTGSSPTADGPATTTTSTAALATDETERVADPCAARLEPVDIGRLADPELDEVSGAALSRRHPDTIWLIEDSGNPPVITATDRAGTTVARISLDVDATDWEDLSLAPGTDGTPHLFVADIGDNQARRSTVTVLRLPEPDPLGGDQTLVPDRLEITLADGAADAEALLVDGDRGDLVIVTKDAFGVGQVLVAPGAAVAGPEEAITAETAGEVDLGLLGAALAGDASRTAGTLALRTPSTVWLWSWTDDRAVAEVLTTAAPCPAPSVTDVFGEALALDDSGGYLLAGEGVGTSLWLVAPGGG